MVTCLKMKKSTFISESRKIRKPLMEKKRRARINDSLETLKQILLDSKTVKKEGSLNKRNKQSAKLEKADILEMTVQYLQHLHSKLNSNDETIPPKKNSNENCVLKRAADSSSSEDVKMGLTLIPATLKNGQFVLVSLPTTTEKKSQSFLCGDNREKVWRPW